MFCNMNRGVSWVSLISKFSSAFTCTFRTSKIPAQNFFVFPDRLYNYGSALVYLIKIPLWAAWGKKAQGIINHIVA